MVREFLQRTVLTMDRKKSTPGLQKWECCRGIATADRLATDVIILVDRHKGTSALLLLLLLTVMSSSSSSCTDCLAECKLKSETNKNNRSHSTGDW